MWACRIFFSKSLAHFSPSFPHLTGGGSTTYLPWIQRLNRWGFTQGMVSVLCSDRTRFHISQKFHSGTFWQLQCCYIASSPSPLLAFGAGVFRTALSAAGKQSQHGTTLGLCPSQEIVLRTHYRIICFSMYKQPCCHSLKGSFCSFLQGCSFTSSTT